VTIRNAVVSDNSGGQSAIYVGVAKAFGDSPSLNLEGCLTLENNSPADIIDGGSYLTDKSTGPCENPDQIGSPDPASSAPSAPRIADKSKRVRRPEYTQKKVRTCPELAPEILVTDMTGSTQCQRRRIGLPGCGLCAAQSQRTAGSAIQRLDLHDDSRRRFGGSAPLAASGAGSAPIMSMKRANALNSSPAGPWQRRRDERDILGGEDEAASNDALRIGADGGRRVAGGDDLLWRELIPPGCWNAYQDCGIVRVAVMGEDQSMQPKNRKSAAGQSEEKLLADAPPDDDEPTTDELVEMLRQALREADTGQTAPARAVMRELRHIMAADDDSG